MAEQDAAVDRLHLTQRFIELLPSDDWVTAFQDEAQLARVRAAFGEMATPDLDVEGMIAGERGLVAPVEGVDGLIGFWREWLTPWESFTLDLERIVEGPDGVLLEVVQKGRLEGSTAVVETASGAVLYFREDRLARIEFHIERAEARKAAGLA
jgi:hypothetical protein